MSKRRRGTTSRRVAEARFWGSEDAVSPSPVSITPTPDPSAMVRSLGPIPLAIDAAISERHLAAVYEEAVRAATALAAANGLLALPED